MSFALQSSIENFGSGRRSTSVGSKSSFRRSWPVKSSIGLMSAKVSASPRLRNQPNESRWTATRSGSSRTSSRFAKEKRSGVRKRDGNGSLLADAGSELRDDRKRCRGRASPRGSNSGAAERHDSYSIGPRKGE